MKRLILISILAAPSVALAEDCSRWNAKMEDDEGGRVMTASICSLPPREQHSLSLTCGDGSFLLRWFPPEGLEGYPPGGGEEEFETSVTIAADNTAQKLAAQFSPYDGAMEMQWQRADPLTNALKSGSSMTLTPENPVLPAVQFSLRGSGAAIARVERACSG